MNLLLIRVGEKHVRFMLILLVEKFANLTFFYYSFKNVNILNIQGVSCSVIV